MKIMNEVIVATSCNFLSDRERCYEVLYGNYVGKRVKCSYCGHWYVEPHCPICGMTNPSERR